MAYSINGSWYFNKTNTFSSFEEESIGYMQFNGEIINIMLPTKLALNFNFHIFDTYLTHSGSLTPIIFSNHLQTYFKI